MRQVFETSPLSVRAAGGRRWLSRLGAWLLEPRDRHGTVGLHGCSRHMLRDIGLLDDRRGNALLRDDLMLRR